MRAVPQTTDSIPPDGDESELKKHLEQVFACFTACDWESCLKNVSRVKSCDPPAGMRKEVNIWGRQASEKFREILAGLDPKNQVHWDRVRSVHDLLAKRERELADKFLEQK